MQFNLNCIRINALKIGLIIKIEKLLIHDSMIELVVEL